MAKAEDPRIWSAILEHHAWGLWEVDDARAGRLYRAIWIKYPDAFGPEHSHLLWRHGRLIPADVRLGFLLSWLETGDGHAVQLVGEFAVAGRMMDPNDTGLAALGERMLGGEIDAGRIGAVFALAAVWRQFDDPELRAQAHALLAPIARMADGEIAVAVSSALDNGDTLSPDELTREMMQIAVQNPSLMRACLNMHFADSMQELLHHPTFGPSVLDVAEQAVDIMLKDDSENRRGLLDQDFVTIAIALQRSVGEQRTRAMNIYERLLEAGNHYAGVAAKDSTVRV